MRPLMRPHPVSSRLGTARRLLRGVPAQTGTAAREPGRITERIGPNSRSYVLVGDVWMETTGEGRLGQSGGRASMSNVHNHTQSGDVGTRRGQVVRQLGQIDMGH